MIRRLNYLQWSVIVITFGMFTFHSLMFWDWIVDDAGISFVYARSLAEGYGLVSQPGSLPVEGYSNPLWTLLMSPMFLVGLFDPIVTPKLVSLSMVLLSFIMIVRIVGALAGFTVLLLLGINTSFVVWVTSGLENPLYVLLLSCLLLVSIKRVAFYEQNNLYGIATGVTSGGMALTRPEGMIFFGIYPLVLLISNFGRYPFRELFAYLLSFSITAGAYEVFRLAYFGEIFPNTYYGKDVSWVDSFTSILTLQSSVLRKFLDAVVSLGSIFAVLSLLVFVVLNLYMIYARNFLREHFVLLLFLGFTAFAYLILPTDWMGEFRFATLFILCLYAYGVMLVYEFFVRFRYRYVFSVLAGALLVSGSLLIFPQRSEAFARYPTLPIDDVAEEYGFRYNDYAERLGIEEGSLLVPDVGGTLYYSTLRVYDLGGLTDRVIARTLPNDYPNFYNYVFDEVKPTFIATHGAWAGLANFDSDYRFRRDYTPMREWVEVDGIYAGDYIRKDVIDSSNAEAFSQIKIELSN